ncbi:MAG: hypothetical protein KDC71_21510 [Acidobacteria bacterium]|nr:hypothetical protein [Acidobacteriota bacterium]
MIPCEYGEMGLHLGASLIKFLNFQRFSTQADQLALHLTGLGDLMNLEVVVRESFSGRQVPARWRDDVLYADLRFPTYYDLQLRLEFGLPIDLSNIACDFQDIHPMTYQIGLHLLEPEIPHQMCTLRFRSDQHFVRLNLPQSHIWQDLNIQVDANSYQCGIRIQQTNPALFPHAEFPSLSLGE